MSWSIFCWVVLPPGAALTMMLASGKASIMWAASKALDTPMRVGNFQLSLAAAMASFCGVVSLLCYSSLQHSEAKLASTQASPQALIQNDALLRNVFHHGRNLYMSLLGLTLWAMAWRLKVLRDTKLLSPPAKPQHRGSSAMRGIYAVLGLLALALADIPMCRINYNFMLSMSVTPKKNRLLASVGPCESASLATASGPCGEFCEEAKRLSYERLSTIQWARDWHVLGRVAAEIFDDSRGVQQGDERINTLFDRKTCAQVVRSVDKSNEMVNGLCFLFAGVAILGAISAFVNAFGADIGAAENTKRD